MTDNMKSFRMIAACLFAVCSLSVYADDGLSCGSLSLEKGQSGNLEIYYVAENAAYSGVTFTLTLPEGVEPNVGDDGITDITKGDLNASTITATYRASKGTCQFLVEANTVGGKLFKQKKGLLLSLKLNATGDVSSGLVDVSIQVRSMSAGENEIETGIDKEKETYKAAVGGVPVVINASGYATACSAKALDFTAVEGVDAVFTVSKVADNTATLSPIESKQVPAEAGVVVKGTSGTVFVPFAEGSVAELGPNELIGVTSAKSIAEGCYILQGEEFVSCIAGTLPAGKAYLPATVGSSGAKAFTFDFGDATGINEVKTAKADGAIYSISGVRVAEPQKGVYIMNGRKVIVK